MDDNTFNNIYSDTLSALLENRLGDALASTGGLLAEAGDYESVQRLEALRGEYAMMLAYWQRGTDDAGRTTLYQQFLRRTLEIALAARHRYLLTSPSSYLNLSRRPESGHLFEQILVSPPWNQSHYDDHRNLFTDADTSEADCLQATSALTLAALAVFDAYKLRLLLYLCHADNPTLRIRALVGAALTLHHHRRLIAFYPDIEAQAQLLSDDPFFATDLQTLQLQLLLSSRTRQDSRKLTEEIMPSIMEAAQRIRPIREMDFSSLAEIQESDLNPEWDKDGNESEMHKRMNELAELQMKGADMFFGTFGQLVRKHDYFSRAENWFVPFSYDSPIFANRPAAVEAVKALFRIRPASDTERYALSLMIATLPEAQMSTFADGLGKMGDEMNSMDDITRLGELETGGETRKEWTMALIRFTVQDLYRFFCFFRQRREADSPFRDGIDLTVLPFFHSVLQQAEALQAFAEFSFKEKAWPAAFAYFDAVPAEARTAEMLEKMGFCCLQTGDNARAADLLEQAAAYNPSSAWTLRQLSRAYARMGDTAQSLAALEELLPLDPDSPDTLLRIAQCHISLGEADKAFAPLYKADYLQPGGKALRALAWCSLLTGKDGDAAAYYEKILAGKPTASDWQNAGHAAWITGDVALAVERYTHSLRASNSDFAAPDFFAEDEGLLLERGITPQDLLLMRDAVNGG